MARRRVLLVEDQSLIRVIVAEGLGDAGFDVVQAASGDQALDLLRSQGQFDVVFTDVQMPGIADGNDVGAYVKGNRPGVPVIYASGRSDALTNSLSEKDAFVRKPFGIAEVVAHVVNACQGTSTTVADPRADDAIPEPPG